MLFPPYSAIKQALSLCAFGSNGNISHIMHHRISLCSRWTLSPSIRTSDGIHKLVRTIGISMHTSAEIQTPNELQKYSRLYVRGFFLWITDGREERLNGDKNRDGAAPWNAHTWQSFDLRLTVISSQTGDKWRGWKITSQCVFSVEKDPNKT